PFGNCRQTIDGGSSITLPTPSAQAIGEHMPGALDGFRIIDLTSNVAGPLGTMILGDQGADVIKVEPPPGGDSTRSGANRRGGLTAGFLNNNRNKRSIVLDLKNPAAREALFRLCAGADAFVQNYR